MVFCTTKMSVNRASTERQQSVNNVGCCILYNPKAMRRHWRIFNVSVAFMLKSASDMVTAPLGNWASTQRQQFQVLHLVWSKGCAMAFMHNRSIGRLYRQYRSCRCCCTWKWASTERQRFRVLHLVESKGYAAALPIIKVLAILLGNTAYVDVASPENERQHSVNKASTQRQHSVNTASTERRQSINRASTECQQSWVMHPVKSKGYAMGFTHNRGIGSLYVQKRQQHAHSPILKMSVNQASTDLGVASCRI